MLQNHDHKSNPPRRRAVPIDPLSAYQAADQRSPGWSIEPWHAVTFSALEAGNIRAAQSFGMFAEVRDAHAAVESRRLVFNDAATSHKFDVCHQLEGAAAAVEAVMHRTFAARRGAFSNLAMIGHIHGISWQNFMVALRPAFLDARGRYVSLQDLPDEHVHQALAGIWCTAGALFLRVNMYAVDQLDRWLDHVDANARRNRRRDPAAADQIETVAPWPEPTPEERQARQAAAAETAALDAAEDQRAAAANAAITDAFHAHVRLSAAERLHAESLPRRDGCGLVRLGWNVPTGIMYALQTRCGANHTCPHCRYVNRLMWRQHAAKIIHENRHTEFCVWRGPLDDLGLKLDRLRRLAAKQAREGAGRPGYFAIETPECPAPGPDWFAGGHFQCIIITNNKYAAQKLGGFEPLSPDDAAEAVSTALELTGDARRPFRPSHNWSLAQEERERALAEAGAGGGGLGEGDGPGEKAQENVFVRGAVSNCYRTATSLIRRIVSMAGGELKAEHYKPSPTSERSFGFKLPERFRTKACLENLADWIRAEAVPDNGDLRRRPRAVMVPPAHLPDLGLDSSNDTKGKSGSRAEAGVGVGSGQRGYEWHWSGP
jgi:hypothetical protein